MSDPVDTKDAAGPGPAGGPPPPPRTSGMLGLVVRRPVAVFTLHSMDGDGGDLRAISAFENFEWTPSVASDGTILYARWDYIDRFNGHFMSLWSTWVRPRRQKPPSQTP